MTVPQLITLGHQRLQSLPIIPKEYDGSISLIPLDHIFDFSVKFQATR